MIILTNGYKKPEDGDKGSIFWDALAFNWDRMDGHSHNGTDSAKLTAESVDAIEQTLSNGDWIADGSKYKQTVTMPLTLEFDKSLLQFKLNTGTYAGYRFHPSIKKITANTFDIWINDNSVDVKVYYA